MEFRAHVAYGHVSNEDWRSQSELRESVRTRVRECHSERSERRHDATVIELYILELHNYL